uniref:Uncharacterized protein n=1 Tax=Romanomermis culicivorax TaxID=13658 RepID=A0A915JRC6_ROMCU
MSYYNATLADMKRCQNLEVTVVFVFETCLIAVMSIAAQYCNYSCLRAIYNSGGNLPRNVKILMLNCNTAFLIRSFHFMSLAIYHFLLTIITFQIEFVRHWHCAIFEFFYVTTSIAGSTSLFFVSLERLYVTCKKNKSDRNNSEDDAGGWKITIACATTWIIGATTYVIMIIIADHSRPICYCYVTAIWPAPGVKVVTLSMILILLISCLIYYAVYRINRRYLCDFTLNTARHSLTERFVMWCNVSATRWLIPVTIFHGVISIFVMATINIGLAYFSGVFTTSYVNFIVAYLVIYCLDTLLHPVLCVRYNRPIRKIFLHMNPAMASFDWSKIFDFFSRHFSIFRPMFKTEKNDDNHHRLSKSGDHRISYRRRFHKGDGQKSTSTSTADGKHEETEDDRKPTTEIESLKEEKSLLYTNKEEKEKKQEVEEVTVCCTGRDDYRRRGFYHGDMTGRRQIVEYRMTPEKNQDIIEEIWNGYHK